MVNNEDITIRKALQHIYTKSILGSTRTCENQNVLKLPENRGSPNTTSLLPRSRLHRRPIRGARVYNGSFVAPV